MKLEYIRIDLMQLLIDHLGQASTSAFDYLRTAPDCEYREDYQCFFVLVGSQTYSWIALKYPELIK
jgi:hypothetical protein